MSILQSKLSGLTQKFLEEMQGLPDTQQGRAQLQDCLRTFTVQARRLQFVSMEQEQIAAREVYLDMPDMRKTLTAKLVTPAKDPEHHESWYVRIVPEFMSRFIIDSPKRIPLGSTIWDPAGQGRVVLEIDRVWGPSGDKEYYLCSCEVIDG